MSAEQEKHHTSRISSDIEFKGDVQFENTLEIEGFFEGTIETKGVLNIHPGGVVKAEVRANTIYLGGELQGIIRDAKFVHVHASAKVKADIQSKDIQVDRRANINGVLLM